MYAHIDGCCLQVAKSSQPDHSARTSIHSLKQRLAPYGFERSGDFNGRLCLDNLFEREWKGCSGNVSCFQSKYIDLDSCPLEELPPMPTQQRVESVTVVYLDGSRAPITYGIHIDWYATNQQLSDGVQKQCDLSENKQIVLVLLECNRFSRYCCRTDCFQAHGTGVLHRSQYAVSTTKQVLHPVHAHMTNVGSMIQIRLGANALFE